MSRRGNEIVYPGASSQSQGGRSYHRRYRYHRQTRRTRDGVVEERIQMTQQQTINNNTTTSVVVMSSRRLEQRAVVNRPKEIKHFSHSHALDHYNMEDDDGIICDVCEIQIVGKGYGCEGCCFFIHKACLHLPRQIDHKSHCAHSLKLYSSPTYEGGAFACNACRDPGLGFVYHCSICKFDLHVACAGIPSTVRCVEVGYPLKLHYNFPIETSNAVLCDICDEGINQRGWSYFNAHTCFIAHIGCALDEEPEDMVAAMGNRLGALQLTY